MSKILENLFHFVDRKIASRFIKSENLIVSECKYNLGMVAIIKNEADYIDEWIRFHKIVGFEHFYIYDNGSTDETIEVLKPYVVNGDVSIVPWSGLNRQIPAYNNALRMYKKDCRYIAFLDGDEFLCPCNKDEKLLDIIDGLFDSDKDCGGIVVNWRMFGSAGHVEKPLGGVLENYLYRAKDDGPGNYGIKTIVDPRKVYKFYQPHNPFYLKKFHSIDENGNIVKTWDNKVYAVKRLRINHYFTKSKEEWIRRRSLGKADDSSSKRSIQEFYEYDNNDIYDDLMLYYVNLMRNYN